ncbi:MFS transporter, MCP family, solute carrier family 16 (monocarboxylic acid transporters), member 14 [Mytilus galloprovincialis]|uniref:MFS transporter, MCP family, solute carrier family 16 (Monocarboxylic acid transporters), member 14 n=1 Tax=Mytilus galloprovincialis TaxID=29158 RepID=A0A8B6CZK7_MYTGA|nr:MFS transporter, MCP family, solute carrier family 16 (monocarboxylic acid transporters), member 14 [Mytilus galloprovincialis]
MSNKNTEGCVNKAFTDSETAVISVDSSGQTYPITSRTEPTVIPEHSEGQVHPITYRTETSMIDIGERQDSLERETLNTELQITDSVLTAKPERKEETNEAVLWSVPTVPERKEEDSESVLQIFSKRNDEDTYSVLPEVLERKEGNTYSVLQDEPERKEENQYSVVQAVPERKEENTYSVLQDEQEWKEENTYSGLQAVPERREEDMVIQIPADECNLYFNTGIKREQELMKKSDKFADDGLEEIITNIDGAQDGGWGWFIVLSSLMIHFIIGGFDRSGGILYLKFEEKFKTPAAVTAWVPSISGGLRLALGPVVSVMCHRFSFRSVVIWSGLILAFALIISGFAPNIYFLFVSYGVIGGLGQAMAYSPAVVIVTAYFHKKLGTALGLATSGVGLGTFAIPLLLEASFTYYGYLGALIMAAAASVEIIVCGALMRPISLHRRITEFNNRKGQGKISVNSISGNLDRIMTDTEQSTNAELTTDYSRNHQNAIKPQLLNDVDIVISVSENKRKLTSRKSVVSMLRRASTVFLFNRDSSKTKIETKFFDLSLLKDLRYSAFCVAILLFTLAFSSGMVFLPAFALQIGTSEFEAAYTVVVTGVSDGIGRLFAGFLFDRKFMKPYRVYIYNVLIIFMGVVSLTIPSVTTFPQLAVACAIYGSIIGMYVSQKSVIIVDLLGIENLSKSFGIVLFFQGIGVFIGPPLSGLLKDLNGTYDYAFYFGGIAVLLGSCILLVSNIIHFLKSRRQYHI